MEKEDISLFVTGEKSKNILQKLVRVNSSNSPGNEMDMVKTVLSFFPKDINYKILNHGNNRGSLIIEILGEREETIAFVGHIDTVPVSDVLDWKYPPFDGVIEGEYLYGRGASDMKGGVTSMILTALYFIENDIIPPVTIKFCFTADEESDGTGVKTIRDEGYFENVTKIFISEPSDEKISICEKGALWLNICVKGKSSHASKPELGVNAIEKLMEYIKNLELTMDLEKKHPLLGRPSFTITKIEGGIKTNIIPDRAEVTVDIRTIPGFDHEDIIKKGKQIVCSMCKENSYLDIELKVTNNRPPLEISKDNEFIKQIIGTYDELSYPVEFKGTNFYTDASQIIPNYSIPFVILGPGEENMAHQKNERIKVKSIEKIAKLYISYILSI